MTTLSSYIFPTTSFMLLLKYYKYVIMKWFAMWTRWSVLAINLAEENWGQTNELLENWKQSSTVARTAIYNFKFN